MTKHIASKKRKKKTPHAGSKTKKQTKSERDEDALHASVLHVWDEVTNEEAFKKVINRL